MVSQRTDFSADELKRHRISAMIAFLSLLTDVAMDEQPTAGQLTRFFNTPNPSLNLSLASLTLSQIVDQDGYLLWEHHGDMLYAAEASGLLDAVRPIFQVFSRYNMASELARLMALLDQHYPTPEMTYLTQGGQPAPRAGPGTGLVRFEKPLRNWLLKDRLFPALHQLALINDQIESRHGRSMAAVTAEWIAHALTYDSTLTRRDGRAAYRRADGINTPFNRLLLLSDSLDKISSLLEANSDAQRKWERASEAILNIFLEVGEDGIGEAYFVQPGSVALGQAVIETLAKVVHQEREANHLINFMQNELYFKVEEILIGRTFPLLIDLYRAATHTLQDRELLRQCARYLVSSDGRRSMLIMMYDLLAELSTEDDMVNLTHALGDLLDPERTWGVDYYPQPLLSHSMLILQESQARAPDSPLLDVIRNALTRTTSLSDLDGDPQGATPLWTLGGIFMDYNREVPNTQGPLESSDYARISFDLARWLRDEQRGMEQIYKLVQSRKKETDP